MSRRRHRSPSHRRPRRSSPQDSLSPGERRRDNRGRRSSRRRARSLSPGYESTAERFRTRRRPRHRSYSSESDGIHTDNAELGSIRGRERDFDSDRGGGRRSDRHRGRRNNRRRRTKEELMKEYIFLFLEDYLVISKMVLDETARIRKLPCMERFEKYYDGKHRPLQFMDRDCKPHELLKCLEKDVKKMGDKLNRKYRSKYFDEKWDDELDSSRSSRRRSTRRSPERSHRRRDSGRRDSYEPRRNSRRRR